jgi:acetyl esterase/lipase
MTTRAYLDEIPAEGLRIRYGSEPSQFGDLRVPAGAGPHPVVVVIHGGWWRAQYGLTYAGHLCAALTADGMATWNIEYRRAGEPGGGFPGTLADVAAALVALRALAPEYGLDLARIVVAGHSAGGHLAAWLAAKPAHRALDVFGESLPIAGAVPVGGVLDLVRTSDMRIENDGDIPVHDFLGGAHDEVAERYALACPALLVPTGIPVTAVHGTADVNVPIELAERYVARAQAAGDPATLIALPGVDHFEPFDPHAAAGVVVRDAIRDLIAQATPAEPRGLQRS